MTKTQAALLARALRQGGAASVEAGSGRGANGGRVSYGARELAALWALEAAGKIRITARDSGNEFQNGFCVRSTLLAFRVL